MVLHSQLGVQARVEPRQPQHLSTASCHQGQLALIRSFTQEVPFCPPSGGEHPHLLGLWLQAGWPCTDKAPRSGLTSSKPGPEAESPNATTLQQNKPSYKAKPSKESRKDAREKKKKKNRALAPTLCLAPQDFLQGSILESKHDRQINR